MLRTAIIGYGGVARGHVNDIKFFAEDNPLRAPDDPVVELAACCDVMPAARDTFRKETGVRAVYETVGELLDAEALDYVHIATCADAHLEPVLACAEAGVHVLCEKPLATEPAECDAMIEACRRAGVQFVVSHQRQSSPMYWYLRKLVDEGLIGEPRHVVGGAKSRRGGQEMHNIGSHLIDAVGILAGDIDWVFGYCTTDGRPSTAADREPGDRGSGWVLGDRVEVTLGYRNGILGSFRFNEDPGGLHWILSGTEGRLAMFNNTPCVCPELDPNIKDRWEPLEIPAVAVTTRSGYVNPPDWVAITEKMGAHPRVFMMREMFQRMETGGEHTSSGRIGAVPIEVIQATIISHLQARRVPLPVEPRASVLA